MPVPIKSIPDNVNNDQNYSNYSFLVNVGPNTKTNKFVTASNSDANSLFNLWENGEKIGEDTYKIEVGKNVTMRDVMRLKAVGLITGGSDKFKITPRGKSVIKIMSLGEQNKFEKRATPKDYNEILACISKAGKKKNRLNKTSSLDKFSTLENKDAQTFIAILNGIEGQIHVSETGQIDRCYVENEIETPQGSAYIQIYLGNSAEPTIIVERYYENEYINDSFSETNKVPIDFNNPQLTITQINEIIQKMKAS